jgi:hypothetical protein
VKLGNEHSDKMRGLLQLHPVSNLYLRDPFSPSEHSFNTGANQHCDLMGAKTHSAASTPVLKPDYAPDSSYSKRSSCIYSDHGAT